MAITTFNITEPRMHNLLADGLLADVRSKVRDHLRIMMEEIVDDAVDQSLDMLKAKVNAYNDFGNGNLVMQIAIDGVRQDDK